MKAIGHRRENCRANRDAAFVNQGTLTPALVQGRGLFALLFCAAVSKTL
jgi:hypothetical protein